jgi:hypothetical protein
MTRERDPIWDALTDAFGEVRTPSERGRRNRAVRELKEAQATPEEIAIAVSFCRKNFTSYSEIAVCNWLSRSLHEHTQSGAGRNTFIRLLSKEGAQ